jgi:translocation and assembly module TamB
VTARKARFKWPWPKIEGLAIDLAGDRDGLKLDRFSVSVEGQAVRATGRLPAAFDKWRELRDDPREFLQQATLHLEIPDADLAAVAQYIPAYLAPKGRLQLDLTTTPDAGLSGFVRVRDAASRPLGPLGVLQEVNAEIRLANRQVELREVGARMGGQRVLLQGHAALPENGEPRMELSLKGENLPFVRRTGLLLRGDLDLKLEMRRMNRSAITGTVRLRDSLFLSDLRALIPSGTKGSAARPPYFSVDAAPVNVWRIDVDVLGDKFMRLRTPVFNGTASAHFHVAGTLGEPRASGEATIDNGSIRLPFASFSVQQGELRLAGDQSEPTLLITGTTRRYGYDLRMELTGPVSAPNLTFSSSPPLAAEQLLLMVMAGQAPHDEITTTDRQRIARFGAFFGQSLIGTLGGDSAGEDRLTISSGENISEQGRETYSIEYKLNNRWSLTGEYDEFDEYYGGLKWRIYTKGGEADEKK